MKKSIVNVLALILAALSVSVALCGCATTIQTEADSVMDEIASIDTVSACLYSEAEEILIVPGGKELAGLMQGEWVKRDGVGDGKKVLSVTVSTQYEVCFFDDGTVMVYYGYSGVFEKDRQYYNASLSEGLEALVGYVEDKGIVMKCNEESFTSALQKSEEVSAAIGDNTYALSGGSALAAFMQGDWEKRSDSGRGDIVLTLEVPMQYGISFFDDGTARIYCNELKKGRQYFDVSLDSGLDSLVEYVRENGEVIEDDDAKSK